MDMAPGLGLAANLGQPAPHCQKASLVRWTYGFVNRIVLVTDGVAIMAGTALFWAVVAPQNRPLTYTQAGTISLLAVVTFISMMLWTRRYRYERYSLLWQQLADLLRAFVPALVAASLVLWAFMPDIWRHPASLQAWAIAVFAALVIGRQFVGMILRVIERRELLRRRVVLVGSGMLAENIAAQMKSPLHARSYELVATFDQWRDGHGGVIVTNSASSIGTCDFIEFAQNYAIDLVIIALPWDQSDKIEELVQLLQWISADVVVPFERIGLKPQFVNPISFIDAPLLQLSPRPFKGSQGFVKLLEDYAVAAIGLLLLWPIMVLAALAIKLTDKGPVFFRQERVGFNSKPFRMLKFRTMTVNPADDGSRGTDRSSHRITPIGRFLRRTSIDEIPQLINVLRGEMSVVGPRPHVANMLVGNQVYTDVARRYAARHRIKPGITGWAQINGMRGGINTVAKANRGAELDLFYIANWSLRFDIVIMLRTVFTGLVGQNVF